jgi:NAD(P)-dependent dehydrogenase (short-subunit alcohol dehydrogenase family)
VSIQDNRLQGRVAFVTGGGSGIGAATAKRLAQAGAAVFVTDVDAASAERIAAEIRQAGGRSKAAEHDVTDEAQWERVVGLCVQEFGGLNVLVNNAGIAIMCDVF